MNLTARYYVCQSCGRPIRNRDRVEKCAFSSKQMCSNCSVADRFSPSVAHEIPTEYHEKFRIYNDIVWFGLVGLLLALVGSSWWDFTGWDSSNVLGVIIGLGIVLLKWIIALVILFMFLRLPRLGTWLFYWWIEKPENHRRMEEDVERYQAGNYETQDVWYYRKLRLFYLLKKMKLRPLSLGIIVGNLAMIYFFIAAQLHEVPPGTQFSAIVGLLFVLVQIANILSVWAGTEFYCKKEGRNNHVRRAVELFSWGYMFFLPSAFIMFAGGNFIKFGVLSAIPLTVGTNMLKSFTTLFVFSSVLMVILGIILLIATPDFTRRNNKQEEWETTGRNQSFLRKIIILSFLLGFLLMLVLSSELIMTDIVMVNSILSYYLVILYAFVIFALLKLLPPSYVFHLFRRRLTTSSLIKLSAVIMIVNFLPLVGTLTVTNPSLETQFSDMFGTTWKNDIKSDPTYPFMREVSFSAYDAYFGFEIPINARYGEVYMQSHPRYVKDHSTGNIISNGSIIFESITHDLKFDAYLPARPEFGGLTFGDARPEKFPVLIFLHGAGSIVDRGAWNANYTTQYFANLGYAAFDVSFGAIEEYVEFPSSGESALGYDFVDSVLQIANFTKYLETHSDYYHANLTNTYVIGRSLGGWMALCFGYLAKTAYAGGNFSNQMELRGVIPFYPASDFPGLGSEFFGLLFDLMDYFDLGPVAPQIRGSSIPTDPDYNPNWLWYNPLWLAENADPDTLPFTFGFQGTHDSNIPAGATRRLEGALKQSGQKVIAAYYPFVGHTFDVVPWSPYGQSVLYYMERFMALTSIN
jgi:acetyl esterase/lipase